VAGGGFSTIPSQNQWQNKLYTLDKDEQDLEILVHFSDVLLKISIKYWLNSTPVDYRATNPNTHPPYLTIYVAAPLL